MKHTAQLKTYWAPLGFGGAPRDDLQVVLRRILLDTVVAQSLNGSAPMTQASLVILLGRWCFALDWCVPRGELSSSGLPDCSEASSVAKSDYPYIN